MGLGVGSPCFPSLCMKQHVHVHMCMYAGLDTLTVAHISCTVHLKRKEVVKCLSTNSILVGAGL